MALDSLGNLLIADAGNHRIRKVDFQTGTINTIAGNGTFDFCGDGGAAIDACLNGPLGVALDGNDNLYIADSQNHRVRKSRCKYWLDYDGRGGRNTKFLWRWWTSNEFMFECTNWDRGE